MDNEAIHTSVDSVTEELEPNEHSIDRKTNSANDTKHDSNDIETTSLDDRKNDTETPAPLLEILDAKNTVADRENGVTKNSATTSEEMVRGGWIMLNFQNIKHTPSGVDVLSELQQLHQCLRVLLLPPEFISL